MIKVLVVDDSAFTRKIISELLNEDPEIEVVGTARDGADALEKLNEIQCDVITLDVEMPVLNGIEFLKRLMPVAPKPVVMVSSLTQAGSATAIEALSLGAVDFVAKPSGAISLHLDEIREDLIRKVKAAAGARVAPLKIPAGDRATKTGHRHPAAYDQLPKMPARRVVVIGASTGGPKALEIVLGSLPADLPAGVLVVQHMPAGFTRSLASRLDALCALSVKEAGEGDLVKNGQVLMAPGGYHMVVDRGGAVHLNTDPEVEYVRPSINVTMESAAEHYGKSTVGVVMTGMGKDGAEGMARIKMVGGKTIVQDEATSTIFSMPASVIRAGNADLVLPVSEIGPAIIDAVAARR